MDEGKIDEDGKAGDGNGFAAASPDSLERLLTYYACNHGERTALLDPPNRGELEREGGEDAALSYSFAELERAVGRVSSHLMSLGLGHGEYVALQLPNFTCAPIMILATMRAGLVPCILPVNWSMSQIDRALERIKPKVLVSCGALEGENLSHVMRELAFRHLGVRFVLGVGRDIADGVSDLTSLLAPGGEAVAGSGAGEFASPARLDEPALVSFVDETTPVPHSGGQILSSGLLSALQLALKPGAGLLCAYPFSSIPGLCGFLYPWLMGGGTLHLHHPLNAKTLVRQLEENDIAFLAAPEQLAEWLIASGIQLPPRLALTWGSAHMPARGLVVPAGVELFDMWNLGGLGLVSMKRDGDAPSPLFPGGHICMPEAGNGKELCLAAGKIIDGSLHVRGRIFPSRDMLAGALEWFSLKKRVNDKWLDTGLDAAPGPDGSIIITSNDLEMAEAG